MFHHTAPINHHNTSAQHNTQTQQTSKRVTYTHCNDTIKMNAEEALFLLLVGALWGCTNPLMRKAAQNTNVNNNTDSNTSNPLTKIISKLANIKIWLPYAVNQLGSLLYYKLLASSRLTVSVPICNATAMAFSCITSILLGERVDKPWRAGLGVLFIMVGSGICMMANERTGSVGIENAAKDEL
jgi:drug/metabolite transporter (DMT)-like permease